MNKYAAALVLMSVSGCATASNNAPRASGEAKDPVLAGCDATKLQYAVGQKSSAAVGAQLIQESGARTLRWMPPRTAATMDFRSDRLNVAYNDAMVITSIDCG